MPKLIDRRKPKITLAPNEPVPEEAIAEALRRSGGIFTAAGEMVGLTGTGVSYRVHRSEALMKIVEEVKERTLDFVESMLMKKIREGNIAALIFYLKCQGKKRGFVEKQEIDTNINTKSGGVLVVPGVANSTQEWLESPAVQKKIKEIKNENRRR